MNNTDLVSVIIPTYNRAHLIKRSIDSVLNQTYKNLELIIVDDGSTDNTKEVIDSINDKRIVYIKQENQGASAARNKGIDFAKGEYIAFQDSDDVWLLNKLEIQLKKLKENNADVVFAKKFIFGNLRKRIIPNDKEGFLGKRELPLTLGTTTLLGKREVFINNKFDLSILGIEDFELALRINKNYSIYCIDKPLVNYYIQKDSISSNMERELKDFERIFKNNKNFLNDYSYHSLEKLALIFLNKAVKIKDKERKKEWIKFIFSINKSNKVKRAYFFHKFHIFYKIRELTVKSVTIPLKHIIKIFRKKMNTTDLVSVIIPTYNRAHLIKRSIDSVLNQTYTNLELIIVDDGSTDNTKEVIDSINDKRIVYVKQENQGASAARNKGIDFAKGEYIAFQDSDDAWLLNKLEIQLKKLKENNADVVFSKMFVYGNLLKRKTPKHFKEGFFKKDTLPLGISNGTVLGKKEVFLENKFDTIVPRLQDFELMLRIHKKYSIYCIDEPLVDYYVQTDSISSKPEKLLKAWEIILEKNKNFREEYYSSMDYLALPIINIAFNTQDNRTKSKLFNLAFYFSKSNRIKLECFFYKIYLYKIRELMYKAVSIPTKKIILLLKKLI